MQEERPALEIFKEQIKFTNWLQVYAGIRHAWLSCNDVFRLIDKQLVPCTPDRHAELYMAFEKSMFDMLNVMKEYIQEDLGIKINHLEDSIELLDFPYIPTSAWQIWELEFLLRIRNSGKTVGEQMDDLFYTWTIFKHLNVDWNFLWLAGVGNKEKAPLGEDVLYQRFLDHISKLIIQLK